MCKTVNAYSMDDGVAPVHKWKKLIMPPRYYSISKMVYFVNTLITVKKFLWTCQHDI